MITIILNHHNKYAEVDMPAMYCYLFAKLTWVSLQKNSLLSTCPEM